MQKAAIVILNFNGEEMLRKFLPGVVKFSKYEVIVADNGSNDGSIDFLNQSHPSVRLVRLPVNYGYSEGYNRALDQLRGKYEYYVLLNSDIQVTEHWDLRMIQWLDKHPDVVAAQPKILSYLRPGYFDHAGAGGGFLDGLGYPYCRGRIFNHTEPDQHQYDDQIPVDWASGACFFIRAVDFHQAGGFDKVFFAHMEEIDLCFRLQRAGKKIFYNGEVTVYHVNGGTLSKTNHLKTYLNFRNNLLMLYKNLSASAFAGVFIVRLFFDFGAMVHLTFSSGYKHGKSVAKAYFDFFDFKTSVSKTGPLASKLTRNGKNIFSIAVSYYLKGRKIFPEI